MPSDVAAPRFYCETCGCRSRCLPLQVAITNIRIGAVRELRFPLLLCPPCKLAWIEDHFSRWSPGRRPRHEAHQRYAVLRPADVEALQTVQAWRSTTRRR